MDRRFSAIFADSSLPPTPKPCIPSDECTPANTNAVPATPSEPTPTSRFKRLLKAIRPLLDRTGSPADPTPDEFSNQLWDTIASATRAPVIPKKRKYVLREDKRRRSSAIIVLSFAPATILPPIFRSKDIFGRSVRGEGRDSKFNSISSFASLQKSGSSSVISPTVTSIQISIPEYKRLQSLTRRIQRGLMKQEYLANQLCHNMVQLLMKKENQINQRRGWLRNKREDGEGILKAIFQGRENAGRLFLRKAVFLQRSEGVLAQLKDMLEVDPTTFVNGFVEIRISPETVSDWTNTLRADLKLQRQVDLELLAVVKKGCADKRLLGTINDRIVTGRFWQFVYERIVVLGACYERSACVAQSIGTLQNLRVVAGVPLAEAHSG